MPQSLLSLGPFKWVVALFFFLFLSLPLYSLAPSPAERVPASNEANDNKKDILFESNGYKTNPLLVDQPEPFDMCFPVQRNALPEAGYGVDLNAARWLSFFSANQYAHYAHWAPILVEMGFGDKGEDQDWINTARNSLAKRVEARAGKISAEESAIFEQQTIQGVVPGKKIQFFAAGKIETKNDGFIFFNDESTQMLWVEHRTEPVVVIAFRGTETDEYADLTTNLAPWGAARPGYGFVHKGFQEAFFGVEPILKAKLKAESGRGLNIWITGHSLGGALASLASTTIMDHIKNDSSYNLRAIYTFGMPRVGDEEFVKQVELGYLENNVAAMRFRNANDAATKLPWRWLGYHHSGQLMYLGADDTFDFNPDNQDPGNTPEHLGALADHEIETYYSRISGLLSGSYKSFTTRCPYTEPVVIKPAHTVSILHINDVYRIGGIDRNTNGGMSRLRTLRNTLDDQYTDLLITHAGDFLFPSMLSQEFNGKQMIDLMNRLDGDANKHDDKLLVTFGNHEFDKAKIKDAALIQSRMDESGFVWLSDNISWKKDATGKKIDSKQFSRAHIKELNGVKVGFFGLTTDKKIPEYAEINNDYINLSRKLSKHLREQGAQVIVALTHLPMNQDELIMKTLGNTGPDVILGGHEHNRKASCLGAAKNTHCIIKADADLRTAALIEISLDEAGNISTNYSFKFLDVTVTEDPQLKSVTNDWEQKFDNKFCVKENAADNCLQAILGNTSVTLLGEELEIRRYETNLGNFIVDQALKGFSEHKPQIAFINSGSFRLNQNIPKGSEIRERDLREIFAYPTELKLVEITGAQLQKVVERSIEDWTGNGNWLQISGFKFTHDTENKKATSLQILENGLYRAVDPNEIILAVTGNYLMDPNGDRDGYTMLPIDKEVSVKNPPNLLSLTRDAIKNSGTISPKLESRICSTDISEC